MKVIAIIAAGGTGKRMGEVSGKQFLKINGKPMLAFTIKPFEESQKISDIILVINENDRLNAQELIKKYDFKKIKIVVGGQERSDSVYNGLRSISNDPDIVLIHDGARPLISKEIIERCIKEAYENDAVVVGIPVHDTLKLVDEDYFILKTIDREKLWQAQTPQGFKYKLIKEAYEKAMKNNQKATDDSKLVEAMGKKVRIILGSKENIKVTTNDDLKLASAILRSREEKK